MSDKRQISINVPVLTRVEGEGALELKISNNRIEQLHLKIYEPPRYFEKLLQQRSYQDVPDMVARICGICPVAYQMSAVQALEQAFSFTADPVTTQLRRLLYCGEWIQSHSLHIHLLAAPDFLGYDSAMSMSQQHPELVHRGLALQNAGNEIIRLLGARSVHPVGVSVGSFHTTPSNQKTKNLLLLLKQQLDNSYHLIEWCAALSLPDNSHPVDCVALVNTDEYPMYSGRIQSSSGLDISADEFELHFKEHQVAHSTALHALFNGKPYLVGPLARLNLNMQRIPDHITQLLLNTGISLPSFNMFHSMLARAVEIYIALNDAIHILEDYSQPSKKPEPLIPKAGTGYGCTEAPRGILWHKYTTDSNGLIKQAVIVPPTSQNQARIEQDLRFSLDQHGLDRDEDELRKYSETLIRNYDPCISCATHFLTLKLDR
ncbi:MAG: Ni/Fe hydrogenase subunit alpha [Gammaproteobacteria bacterium]